MSILDRLRAWLWGSRPAEPEPPPSRRVYPRRSCAVCGADLAHTRGGAWTWPHHCASGYGVVHVSGRFESRAPRPSPVLPMETER